MTVYGRTEPLPHPDVARLAERFAAAGVPTYDTLDVPTARALLEGVTRLQRPPAQVAAVRDLLVPGPTGALPARLYDPSPGQPGPLAVYLHGGGWVLGSIETADRPCRSLAAASGWRVLSLGYRLAPETRFPGPLEDCLAGVRWAAAQGDLAGGGEPLVLIGDSAGGNLAAATALCLRDAGERLVAAQLLLYPALAPARGSTSPSYAERAGGPFMTRREMEWFWDLYLPSAADGTDPRAAPLLAPDLSELPAATVVVCELDPLRDEGLAYVTRLRAAGVSTQVRMFAGAAHGFWWMDAAMTQAAELTGYLAEVLRGIAST